MDGDISAARELVPAVTRAAAILDLIASDSSGLSVSTISRSLGLARSSTANLCAALAASGLVAVTGGHYRLGHRVLELGARYLTQVDQVQMFYDLCGSTAAVSRQTARLALLDGTSVVYLARYDGTQPLRLTASIGDRFPASVTATGKAILASLPDHDVLARYSNVASLPTPTENSIPTVSALQLELERTRERGYAIDNEEATPDVLCFAIAVPPRTGSASSMAISATIHRRHDAPELREMLIADLRRIAEGISHPLGGHVGHPA